MVNIESYIGLDSNGIKTFYVDAEFDSHWIDGMTIESMAIGCEKAYTAGSYPVIEDGSTDYWEKKYSPEEGEESVLRIHEEIPLTEFLFDNSPHLWVVYIKVNYDLVNPIELSALPCRDQKTCYVAMVYDFERDLLLALKLVESLNDSCEIPKDLIDEILKIQALKLAIECRNIPKAMYFFTKFFSKKPSLKMQKGGCGCHGRASS